eukprot:9158316-Ditylum_brightwellii.AAC.1
MRTAPTMKRAGNPDVKRAIILFARPTLRTLERGTYHTYKLYTDPSDPDSPTYELSIPFFTKESPEEWIKFRHGLKAVLKGQNVTQGPA